MLTKSALEQGVLTLLPEQVPGCMILGKIPDVGLLFNWRFFKLQKFNVLSHISLIKLVFKDSST